MIENIKKLTSEMDNKKEFVEEVAKYYNKSYDHISARWFSKDWKIPEEYLFNIVSMAQKRLFAQVKRKTNLLTKTGFNG